MSLQVSTLEFEDFEGGGLSLFLTKFIFTSYNDRVEAAIKSCR